MRYVMIACPDNLYGETDQELIDVTAYMVAPYFNSDQLSPPKQETPDYAPQDHPQPRPSAPNPAEPSPFTDYGKACPSNPNGYAKPRSRPRPARSRQRRRGRPRPSNIGVHSADTDGAKVILYGKTGNGKTTLASLREGVIFLSMTDGQQKVINPITGKECPVVQGLRDFQDVRDALHQGNLFPDKCSICIDTVTRLEAASERYIFDNYPAPGKQRRQGNERCGPTGGTPLPTSWT